MPNVDINSAATISSLAKLSPGVIGMLIVGLVFGGVFYTGLKFAGSVAERALNEISGHGEKIIELTTTVGTFLEHADLANEQANTRGSQSLALLRVICENTANGDNAAHFACQGIQVRSD